MLLPAIEDKTILRPGGDKHLVPSPEYTEFWDAFFVFLRKNFTFEMPVREMKDKVNPYFGNFGPCFQAITKTPDYFNLGIDITARAKTVVHAVAPGLLEYSGFGHINGKYVFLSHPEIQTEDGYVLHTLYMHLRSFSVGFSSYQKMLRKMSFNKYPDVPVAAGTKIGEVGSTGNASGVHTHLHFQMEFRNDSGKIVVVDPALVLGIPRAENLTKDVRTEEDFMKIFFENKAELKDLSIEKYWKI